MLRFVQTGDWHLGQPYKNIPDKDLADRLRQARLDAVGRVLAEAERLGAAFVLAAGDQFDHPMPDPRWLGGMLERIGAFPGLVVHMIPGNHDPYRPGCAYDRPDFKARPANLRFHDRPAPVTLDGQDATLYPCPCLTRYGDNPLDWIPARADGDGWRIGLAHGALPNFALADDRNFPIPADAPSRYDLDYLALGDWHTTFPNPSERLGERTYYAGAPEVGGWDEPRAGTALLVELSDDGPPRIETVAVGQFQWTERRPELYGVEDLGRLADDLTGLASPTRLVRLRPTGALSATDRDALKTLICKRAEGFAGLILELDHLGFAAEADAPATVDPLVQAAYRRLARLAADPADGPPRELPPGFQSLDPEVVALALARFRYHLPT